MPSREDLVDPPIRRDLVAELYAREYAALVRFAALVGLDRHGAEDLVQDAFAGLAARGPRLQSREHALAYLRVSILNRTRSLHRGRRVRAALRLDLPDVEPADLAVLRGDEHRRLVAAVARLPRRQREVIALRYWADLSEHQIAQTLGISPGTVKSTAARARAALAAELSGDAT